MPSLHLFSLAALTLHLLSHAAYGQYLLEVLEYTSETQRAVLRCEATGATFGQSVLDFSYGPNAVGCAVWAEPRRACGPVKLRPLYNATLCDSYFAVVARGNCSFSEKAWNVQNAAPYGFDALIIANDAGKAPISMSGADHAGDVDIPSVMINYGCALSVLGQYSAAQGVASGYSIIKYLVPFVVIVLFCFIILCLSLLIRLCRERRRLARKRLSKANLRKIPVKKYKRLDDAEPETCAICLEDFVTNDKVRELPCRHQYHQKCIDPWLLKNRKVCPIDRRKVGPSTGSDSSDSEGERADAAPRPMASADSASLLRNAQPMPLNGEGDFPSTSNNAPHRGWLPQRRASNDQPSTSQAAYTYPTPNAIAPTAEEPSRSRIRGGFSALARRFRQRVQNARSSLYRLQNEQQGPLGSDIESLVNPHATGAENNAFESASTASINALSSPTQCAVHADIHQPVLDETAELQPPR